MAYVFVIARNHSHSKFFSAPAADVIPCC